MSLYAGQTVRWQGIKWTVVRPPWGHLVALKRRSGGKWVTTSAPAVKVRVA